MTERNRGWRQWQRHKKMMRRLKADWNQHYNDFTCPCRTDPKEMSRFADTPAFCSKRCCGNPRRFVKGDSRFTLQERKRRVR